MLESTQSLRERVPVTRVVYGPCVESCELGLKGVPTWALAGQSKY